MRQLFSSAILLAVCTALALGQEVGQPYDPGQRGSEPQGYPDQGTADQGPSEQTRPGQSVARISLLNGDVSVRRGDSGDVVAAAVNAPLMVQDRLMTASSSRAELQLDAATLIRVASNTEVRMSDLQYGHYQIQLAIGTITLRVLANPQGQVELSLPSVAVRPLGPGTYRVSVREDGSADITVREGQAQIVTQGGTETPQVGSTLMVRGLGAETEFQTVAAIGIDEWDRWNQQRDTNFSGSRSSRYVGADVYGTEELDTNGRWIQDATYGNVWAPTVEPGWAPYREGRWAWEDYYGWTWVSSDPFGWAPYHYGRWFNGSAGWCWYPGAAYGRHYWSPALVGFFGFGGGIGVGVGFGFGNVGWVPLAPFEAFHPWWGRGYNRNTFINNTTIVNNTNITNVYRNARVANGITAVNSANFGRNTGRFAAVSGSQIQNAGLIRGMVPVAPDRASLNLSNRPLNNARFPQTSNNRPFFSRPGSVAQTAQRVPFAQQQRSMQQATQQTRVAPQTSTNSGAWRTFNGPRTSAPQSTTPGQGAARGASPATTGGGAWRTYSGSGNITPRTYPPSQGSERATPPAGPRGGAWRTYSGPGNSSPAPSYRTTPQAAPSISGGNRAPSAPRYESPRPAYQAPRSQPPARSSYQPSVSAPRYESARPAYQAPRSQPPARSSYEPSVSAPRYESARPAYQAPTRSSYRPSPSAPRYEAPRSYGGGSQAVRISPPIVRSGGGGSSPSPRSSGGGGGGGGDHKHR